MKFCCEPSINDHPYVYLVGWGRRPVVGPGGAGAVGFDDPHGASIKKQIIQLMAAVRTLLRSKRRMVCVRG